MRVQLHGGGSGTHQEVTHLFFFTRLKQTQEGSEEICRQQGVNIAGKTNLLKDQREPDVFRNFAVWFLKEEGLAMAQQGPQGRLQALWSMAVFREAKFMGSPLLVRNNCA